ncbi:MAG: phosphatase PAP2 family protein [Arenimonas sp.]
MNMRMKYFLQQEQKWCVQANTWAEQTLVRRYFQTVSRLGDGPIWYLLGAIILLVEGRNGIPAFLHLSVMAVITSLLYRYLKKWTKRPRPFANDKRIHVWAAPLDEFSFPSGHTLHAVSFTLVALAYYPVLAPVLIPLAISIALSRVILGLHYPSDVVAATVIGSLLAWASFLIF